MKSTKCSFLSSQKHQTHHNRTGFIAFFLKSSFGNHLTVSGDPKSASRPIFATSLKRYTNTGLDTNSTSWDASQGTKMSILARTCAKSRLPRPEPNFSWISTFATRLTKYCYFCQTDGTRWRQMTSDGLRCPQTASGCRRWLQMASIGLRWPQIASDRLRGLRWPQMLGWLKGAPRATWK